MKPHKSECPAVTGHIAEQSTDTCNSATGKKIRKAGNGLFASHTNANAGIAQHTLLRSLQCYCGGPGGHPGMEPTCIACNSLSRIFHKAKERLLKRPLEGTSHER